VVQQIRDAISIKNALTVRDMLHREAARVQREIVQYSTLTQAALQSTKTIAESLEQWRTAPNLRTAFDRRSVRRASEARHNQLLVTQ